MRGTLLQRFEAKFQPEPMSGCYLWTAAQHQFGYGHILANGKVRVAHQVAYELYVGDIPEGMCVLHRCDVAECVNPAHLFLGTHQDNIADKCSKGRAGSSSRPGEKNPAAKLTDEIVDLIRGDSRAQRAIAAAYGISKTQVGRIRRGESWHG